MEKDREELINSIRDRLPDDEQLDIVEKMAEKMKGKTDEEIFAEIKKLNKEMESQLPLEKYNEVLGKLEKVRPMLSKSQSQKLDMLLESLKEDNKKQE